MGRTYRHEKEWGKKPRKFKRDKNNFFPVKCNEEYTPYEDSHHNYNYYNEKEDTEKYKGKEK